MDLRSQQRLHAQPRQDAPGNTATDTSVPTLVPAKHTKTNRTLKRPIVMGAVALLLLGTLGLAVKGAVSFGQSSGVLGASTSSPTVTQDRYQALFLTNGQVYFGKIVSVSSDTYTLKNIYYLQQNVQNEDKTKDAASQNQLQLTKLGNELHGPEDVMYVERSQVLFWENLKNDSQVVKKINEAAAQKNQ